MTATGRQVTCDMCDDGSSPVARFAGTLASARRAGWRRYGHRGGTAMDLCPACVKLWAGLLLAPELGKREWYERK